MPFILGFPEKCAWLLLRCIAILLTLVSGQVFAVNYTFPGSLPAGCSGSGPAYTCGTLSLAWGDTITINAPKPATITINGNFSTNANTINNGGTAADLVVIVNGTATVNYGTAFTGNLITQGASGNVSIGGTVNGPLTATGKVDLTSNLSRITGNVNAGMKVTVADGARIDGMTTAASVEAKTSCIFGGTITATASTVVLGSATTVAGSVIANGASGDVTHGGGTITGSVTTTGNVRFTTNGARVTGNVTAGGSATLAYGGRIDGTIIATSVSDVGGCIYGGNVTATTGVVSLGYDSKVTGNVIAQASSGGTITVGGSGTRLQVSGCVMTSSTAAGSIKLSSWDSSAGGVCCKSGGGCLPVSNICYKNNSNPAYPLSTAACAALTAPNEVKVGTCTVAGVTDSHTTIQAAVNAVATSGTVWICPGTYNENVNIANKALTLKSSTGNKADVTIRPTATAAIASNAALTVNNLTINSTNAGVNGINVCPSSAATLTLSSVDINVANSQYGDNYAIFQNTSGNGCQGLTLNLSNVVANSPKRGYGIRVNNGAGAHVLNTVSATGGDHGWDNYGALWISGGSSFTATNLDVTYNGGYSARGANAALWLKGIAGNISITANDGLTHAIKTTAGGNYGIYVCPSTPATFTLAGASATAPTTVSTTTSAGWTSGTAIFQSTSGSCSATTFNLSNLNVSSQGVDGGIKINNGGGNHQFNYLTIANGFVLTNGSGATFTDVDMSAIEANYVGYIATLSNISGAVAFTTAQKSQVSYSNVANRMGGIFVAATSGYTIPVTLSNVHFDVTEYGFATGSGGSYGKHTLNATNVTTGSRVSSGLYLVNGSGNHVINNATLYGKNGSGWPLRIDGGADITLTDVDAYQIGTSASGYPAVSLNGFTGNLAVNAVTKTGNRCTGNFNVGGTGTANSIPGACIMSLDTAGGTVSTNRAVTGFIVCNAVGTTSQVTMSGLYAQGSNNGITLYGGGSCGKYTANLSNVTAEVTSAYFGASNANPDTMNNHGWARPISIGNGTGAHVLTNVTAIGTYAYSGISINGGGATLTDVYATGLVSAVSIAGVTGPVTISNPIWAATNLYPATNPATFPIRGVSWPGGINGSGLDVSLGTTSATTVTLRDTAVGGVGTGVWLNYNAYSYPNLRVVMSNVTVDSTKADGVVLFYGTGQAHAISDVTVTAARTAMNLARGTNAALSDINLTCGNDGTTAGYGLYLNYQTGTTLSGDNTVTCKSQNSTGISVGGGDGGCVGCTVSGATIDMSSKIGSTGIYSYNGDGTTRTITGNYVKNAPSYGIYVADYPVTVTNNIIEDSGSANFGINMSRGAGIAYNNCVYSLTGHVITSQTSLCAGASSCNNSYPLIDPKPSASATKQGNFWGSWPTGSGYSDTCRDNNSDGLCDADFGGDKAPLKSCQVSKPGAPTTMVAHYKFDDTWGASDTLEDSSGKAKHASLTRTVTQESAPASGSKPDTCKAGNFNKAGYFTTPAGLAVNTAVGKKNSISFWMYWDGGFDAYNFTIPFSWTGGDYGLAISKYRSEMGSGVIGFNTGNGDIYGMTATGLANGWHHVTAVFNNGDVSKNKLYIDGVQKTTLTSYGGQNQRSATATATVGAGKDSDYEWSGKLDEVRIYSGSLTQTQVATMYTQTHACPISGPNHIRIEHSGSGITCAPTTLIIKACADASCSSLYTGGITGTLTATGTPTVNWVGGTGFTIGASGSTTKDVQVTTAGTVTWGATGLSVTPTTSEVCYVGGTSTCSFTSALSGFLFDVPNHVSDTSQSIAVSAVRQSDNSLACAPAFAGVNKTVNFNCGYSNPATGTLPVSVGGTNIACGSAGGVSLAFNASGVAGTTVRYADVGQISLTASYTGSGGSEAGLVMSGSDLFIAAPKDFTIAPTGPYVAGTNFNATVTARNNSGTATSNFGRESPSENATLSFTRCHPTGTGTSPGSFDGSLGSFTSGVANASNLNWSDVGNGDLVAALTSGNYLGSGMTAAVGNTGSGGTVCNGAGNVGPFKPHHFDTSVTMHGCGSFTYSGQPFTIQVTAKNGLATPTTTVNYDGRITTLPVFAKAITLTDANGAAGSWTNGSLSAASFTSGVASRNDVAFTFTNKLTGPATLKPRATDTDGVSSTIGTEDATPLRSGRLRLSYIFGPATGALGMTVQTQYWSGNSWVINGDDGCTSLLANAFALSGALAASTTASAVSLMGGNGTLTLTKSTAGTGSVDVAANLGATGSDQSCLGAHGGTAANKPWLRSQNGSCAATHDRDPSARATFGIYAPETRRTVHVRELY